MPGSCTVAYLYSHTWKVKQEGQEFKAILRHTANLRPIWATKDPVSPQLSDSIFSLSVRGCEASPTCGLVKFLSAHHWVKCCLAACRLFLSFFLQYTRMSWSVNFCGRSFDTFFTKRKDLAWVHTSRNQLPPRVWGTTFNVELKALQCFPILSQL